MAIGIWASDDLIPLEEIYMPDPLLINHLEGVIKQQEGRIKELEDIIEALKIDVNDKAY